MTAPYVGQMVLYYQGDYEAPVGYDKVLWQGNNGTRFHPAVVTRVWGETTVNLMVFFDATAPIARPSMVFLIDELFANDVHCSNSGWRWTQPPAEPSA